MDPGDISKLKSWTDPVMDGLGVWSEGGEKGLDPFVLNSDLRPLGGLVKMQVAAAGGLGQDWRCCPSDQFSGDASAANTLWSANVPHGENLVLPCLVR